MREGGRHGLDQPLDYLDDLLLPPHFTKIHRSGRELRPEAMHGKKEGYRVRCVSIGFFLPQGSIGLNVYTTGCRCDGLVICVTDSASFSWLDVKICKDKAWRGLSDISPGA